MKLVIIALALMLSGCFEEGTIELSEDRINVRVAKDSHNMMGMLAEAFLRAERAMDGYLIEGLGRNVYFDRYGIVPAACTSELNCFTYTKESLHALAIDTLEVHVGLGVDLEGCSDSLQLYEEIRANAISESRWIASDLRRLGFENVIVRHDRFCSPGIPDPDSIDSTTTGNSGIFLTSFVLNNQGAEPLQFNELDRYRLTDSPTPPCFSDECRQGIEFGRMQVREFEIPDIPENVGRFPFQSLNRIVLFHVYFIRSECPTVDPINWAFHGECY